MTAPQNPRAKPGDNSRKATVGGIAGDRLRSFIERIERLEDEKRALSEDIREVYSEAKGAGFDVKVMRQIVRIRKLDQNERDEQEALLETYMAALGMLKDTPLGDATLSRAGLSASSTTQPQE